MEFYKDWKAHKKDDTNGFYHKYAVDYDVSVGSYGWSNINSYCANLLSQYVSPTDGDGSQSVGIKEVEHVLDLGCGTGISGNHLRESGFRNLIGIDGSKEMIEKARSKKVYEKLYEGKLTENEDFRTFIENGSFRYILCVGCISRGHIRITDFLPEIIRILQDGGIAVYTVSSSLDKMDVLEKHMKYFKGENQRLEMLRVEQQFYFKAPDDGTPNYCHVYVVKKI